MELFGSRRAEMWHHLSALIGGKYVDAAQYQSERINAEVGPWVVTLDSVEGIDTLYTRLRAPFRNIAGLRFSISKIETVDGRVTNLGGHDITVGDPFFDETFLVQGNNDGLIVELLNDPEVRKLLEYQPSVHFEVRDNEGSFGPRFPEGSDELYFIALEPINDIEHLKGTFDLFAEVLHQLTVIGATSQEAAGVTI